MSRFAKSLIRALLPQPEVGSGASAETHRSGTCKRRPCQKGVAVILVAGRPPENGDLLREETSEVGL